jgi:hypothetical protein
MIDKLTFTQFLLEEKHLSEALKPKKKIPKPKPRPKKHLWFQDPEMWHSDLQFVHGGNQEYHSSSEEEEESKNHIFATDPTGEHCYGVWQGPKNRGITFHGSRPIHTVKHPRMKIKKMKKEDGPVTNIK